MATLPEEVSVKVLLFAVARDLSGVKEDSLKLPSPISYKKLKELIIKTYSLDSIKGHVVFAHNQQYVRTDGLSDLCLKDGDEIAVIPPLSGG